MCGRFVASSPVDLVSRLFEVEEVLLDDESQRARYNVAPTDSVRTVVERDGVRTLECRRWGLVPHWAATTKDGAARINARAETVHELPAFRDAFARRRCIVPADGFYEWRRNPGGGTQPCYVRPRDGGLLALAGLRATWDAPDAPDPALRTCTIVTTRANGAIAPLHDRMPVILAREAWAGWLDSGEQDTAWLLSLLAPAPDDLLEVVAVGRGVNNVRNDGPSLIERVPDPVQGTLPF